MSRIEIVNIVEITEIMIDRRIEDPKAVVI